ncbi:MAG: phospholipid carrier-dependent glycosyltransferase [Bryobacteraceae bacterium]|nr:phospholipid carrier-dependent glycosyltransferase [Bryobacteraceae bacterium]
MSEAALSLAGALMAMAGAWGWGCLVWRGRAPAAIWALAAGAPVLSLGLFLLLLAGWATPWSAGGLCLAGAAAGFWRRPGSSAGLRPPVWTIPFLAGYGGLYLVHALAPEIEPDAAGYHLGLVAEWLRTGGFAARIGFYEMLPLGVETLFLPAVAVGGYPAAKLVHLGFLITTGPLAARLAARLELPEWAGWAGWLLYAISPVTGVSGTAAYTDAAGVFFTGAAVAALLEWRDSRDSQWLAAAGLAAGFCYAVKLPGALVVVVAVAFPLLHRAWRGAALAAGAAFVGFGPWMLRALWLTGNPVAPLGNAIFPNPHFHEWTERSLTAFLKDYGLNGWTAIPGALLWDGAALQGLLGPAWALLPLGLLAWRRRGGRWLWAAAAVMALPWFANAGARFLMPSLLFAGVAVVAAVPRPAAVALVALHAILSWPAMVDKYANAGAWRLREWPWAVVTGQETGEDYLRRRLWDYRLAELVRRQVPPNEGLLDLYSLPTAYSGVVGVGSMPSARYGRMADTLATAAGLPEPLDRQTCHFPLAFLRAVRWRLVDDFPVRWSIQEATFHYGQHQRPVSHSWLLKASPAPQDAPRAVDGNLATAWHTWTAAPAGSFYEVRFARPQPLDSVQAVMPNVRGGQLRLAVEGERLNGTWIRLDGQQRVEAFTARPLRREAVALVRHYNLRWIVVGDRIDGNARIGRAMAMAPEAWGLVEVARVEGARLFRLRD